MGYISNNRLRRDTPKGKEHETNKDFVCIYRGHLGSHKGTIYNPNSSTNPKNRLLTLTPEDNRGRQSHDKPNGVFCFLSAQVSKQ